MGGQYKQRLALSPAANFLFLKYLAGRQIRMLRLVRTLLSGQRLFGFGSFTGSPAIGSVDDWQLLPQGFIALAIFDRR